MQRLSDTRLLASSWRHIYFLTAGCNLHQR